MITPPRIIFVNRFYWPDQPATAQLLTDLAEGLVRSGFSVTVVARRPSPSHPLRETHLGVHLQRLQGTAWGKRGLAGRAIDFSTFLLAARRELRSELKPGDVVVTMTDPPMLGAVLAGTLRLKRVKWIHWIQDIFPEVAVAVSGQTAARALVPWRDRAWRTADHCVVPGQDMADFVASQGVPRDRLTVSENWSPVGLRPADGTAWRQRHGLTDRFLVMYSGNLGRVHDFSAVIPLARALGPDSRVTFVFVGEGAQKSSLQKQVSQHHLENILFLPAQPREDLAPVLSSGDLHLVTLRDGCEKLVFPSKLYGIAAVGRPALVIGPKGCEPSRTVTTHGFGDGYTSTEVPAIAAFIRRLQAEPPYAASLGEAALRFSQEHGQLSHALAAWIRVLNPLIQLAAPGEARAPSLL